MSRLPVPTADVTQRGEVAEAIRDISSRLGPVEILISSAGSGDVDQFSPFSAAHLERLMSVNWVGLVNAIEAVLPGMIERASGHLVAISSLRAYKGLPGLAGYSATKAAVNSFMDGLRITLRSRGVRATTVCPGFVRTPMTDSKNFPKPFMLEPDEAAARIVTAIRRGDKVCNFPWQAHLLMKLSQVMPDSVLERLAPRPTDEAPQTR